MRYVVPVTPDGRVGPHWGRAAAVAVATVVPGADGTAESGGGAAPGGGLLPSNEGGEGVFAEGHIVDWTVHQVGWDVSHDQGAPGSHHDRVVAFLTAQGITHAVVDHMGPGMLRTLSALGIGVISGAAGDARRAVQDAIPRG